MKQNEKKRDWLNIEYRRVQNKKLVVTVYVLLRLSVVGMLVAQIFNGNFENVYTCILALILFTIPSLIERRLHIDLPDTLEIIILLFIYAAEILGEIQEYLSSFRSGMTFCTPSTASCLRRWAFLW